MVLPTKEGEEVNRVTIGEKLKQLRGERTITEVAKKMGLTRTAYVKYERNERIPRDEVKVKIAKFYGKSVQSIFFS